MATFSPKKYQKVRRITPHLYQLISSGVSQRRAALILKVDRKTIVRRFRFLADEARQSQAKWLGGLESKLSYIQFDDLETSKHTKCKPLSVALTIDPVSRKILNFKVSQMPAKGHLARIAFFKYGKRPDLRSEGWNALMKELMPVAAPDAVFRSDENPHYHQFLKIHHPHAVHLQTKGGRGCVTGQGELKKLKYDPLFQLNHTCAMLRANLNRLFRKTWCTTKNKKGLHDHLAIFAVYFNQTLTASAG